MAILSVKKLSKSYGKHRGVSNVNFEIEKGEIFGFVGPNGAGKSTTIRCVLGLLNYSDGEIKVFDENIETNLINCLSKIGYLPGEVNYYSNMKAIELLRFSIGFYENSDINYVYELAKYFDLDLNAKIDEMSLGNKKKVGIIQCLAHKPEFIILDEPTSGLDPLIQRKFFELLEELNSKGATILFSSHVLSEVQKLCGRVAIIKDGNIISVENINDLQKLNYYQVAIYADIIDKNIFSDLNISDIHTTQSSIEFTFSGNINDLISKLVGVNIKDLKITTLDLEDVFMHYYE